MFCFPSNRCALGVSPMLFQPSPELIVAANLALNAAALVALELIRRILCERLEQGKRAEAARERRARAEAMRRRRARSTPKPKTTPRKREKP
jgi:hypothetical protein